MCIRDSYYGYHFGGTHYFSKKYHLTANIGVNTFNWEIYFKHIDSADFRKCLILDGTSLKVQMLKQGSFNTAGQYLRGGGGANADDWIGWDLQQKTLAEYEAYVAGTSVGDDAILRGKWYLHWDDEVDGVANPVGDDRRRLLHASLYTPPPPTITPTVGTEIEHGKTYKIYSLID